MVHILKVLISFGFPTMHAYAESLVRKHDFVGQLIRDSGNEDASFEIHADGGITISDLESDSTRKLSPSLARRAKLQGIAEVGANGNVVIADDGVSANERSSDLVRDVKHQKNAKFANIMTARRVKHVITRVKDDVELVEMVYTSPQRAANFTVQEVEAIAEAVKHPQLPNLTELRAQEAVALSGKPDPCVEEAITPGCNFAETIVTPGTLAEALEVPLSSVQALFNGEAQLTCQELCQKALNAIPVDARPPKSWVVARRVAGTVFWDIDGSPEHLRNMSEAAEGTPDPDSTETGGASHREGDDHPITGGGSNTTTWPVTAVAAEVCTLFGLYPFVDAFTGSLLDVGSDSGGIRFDTSYQCQSYSTFNMACTCYKKSSYVADQHIYLTWVYVNWWNSIVRAQLHGLAAQVWAPLIFKRPASDSTLTKKMTGLLDKINTDIEVCWDFYYSLINDGVLAYTYRNDKFYYTLSGYHMDLVGKIITWFHEVAHMMPVQANDVSPYGFDGAIKHSRADALKNADSYEIYINRIMGQDIHSTNGR